MSKEGLLEPAYPILLRPPDWKPARRTYVSEAFDQEGWSELEVDLYESLTGRAGEGVL